MSKLSRSLFATKYKIEQGRHPEDILSAHDCLIQLPGAFIHVVLRASFAVFLGSISVEAL